MLDFNNPLVVQSDKTLLLDVHSPLAEECRNALIPFAELVKSPEHIHTYSLTPLSLWNAASAGFTSDKAIEVLNKYARFEVPQSVTVWIQEIADRFGKLRLVCAPGEDDREYLYLVCTSPYIYKEICANPSTKKLLFPCTYIECERSEANVTDTEKQYCFKLNLTDRGTLKQTLLKSLWPVKDDVPLKMGEHLEVKKREKALSQKDFTVREYQKKAADALLGDGGAGTGFGTIVLPCGAGKTIVGIEVLTRLQTNTLIVTTNISAVHQWIDELLDKTTLTKEQIAEYTGENKTICPVTVATYQILTWRKEKEGAYPHFSLFRKNNWGLIIYDEVHMLPAPVFRVVAELQTVHRLGLTATLVREDGCEGYVFSLVGPKRYDVPWKELEKEKWIATAECIEIRCAMDEETELSYAVASPKKKHKIASENPIKLQITKELASIFEKEKILIIGQYIDQLNAIAKEISCPIITGKTPNAERDAIYSSFRNGDIHVLVVSKVANFAIDLPDASMAIQVSGTFGSRQEEAQRLGRILRPKESLARFFTLITKSSVEEDFGSNRQKFLAEQGYSYRIERYTDIESLKSLSQCAIEGGSSLCR